MNARALETVAGITDEELGEQEIEELMLAEEDAHFEQNVLSSAVMGGCSLAEPLESQKDVNYHVTACQVCQGNMIH